ncbi:MAG: hypothetical protein OXJ36_06985 [bacterium]|nr:hypothetical protein [bacterium]MDE0438126.1 hypothetical protein [bacterium]
MSQPLARTATDRLPRGAACGMTRLVLYGVESGAITIPQSLERHRRACLLCQAATVRQRHVMRGLASLRQEVEPLPYDMTSVLDQPTIHVADDGSARTPGARRRPLVAAVASAASVAAIGLVVVAGRRLRSQAS